MGFIYRITNMIDGKRYIGQTKCENIETRWKQHKKVDKNCIGPYLYNAYKKHGIENFKFEIICICFDEDCDKFEKEYMLKYKTITPNGYNIKLGHTFSKHTESSKELIRQKLKERYKTDKVMQKNLGYNRKGRKISEEQKKKLHITSKKYWENMSDEKYKEICQKRKDNYTAIENNNKSGLKIGHIAISKSIGKYDLSGNLLEKYKSISDAAKENNLVHSCISRVCHGVKHNNTAGGFKWKFL